MEEGILSRRAGRFFDALLILQKPAPLDRLAFVSTLLDCHITFALSC